MNQAVITADIEDSTALSPDERKMLFASLKDEMKALEMNQLIREVSFYRGDSFQLLVADSRDALVVGLLLKTCINKLGSPGKPHKRGAKVIFDTAVSIGIGKVTENKPLAENNEKPFVLSGRGLEQLKSERRTLGIFTGNRQTDRYLVTTLYLFDWIMNQWPLTSAELIYHKLQGKTEQEIAKELHVSQSAINQRSHAACWPGLERIIQLYRTLEEHHHD